MTHEPLDLLHGGMERVVGCYLLDTPDGPALFDCGPASCVPRLEEELAARGLAVTDLRHLLLSHIHLDHAGATGVLVRRNPSLQVHVSAIGAPHLVDPAKLEASARRLYGDAFDGLWGALVPVPERNVHVVDGPVLGFETFPSPGHARHHVAYHAPDGTLYCGDCAGVRIAPGTFVLAPCPPPDVDLEAWDATLDEVERRRPERLAVIHFGVFDDPERHVAALRETLASWSARVADGMDERAFVAAARADVEAVDGALADVYDRAAPYAHHFHGLDRYWRKQREHAAA